jgi:G3E family GTPase
MLPTTSNLKCVAAAKASDAAAAPRTKPRYIMIGGFLGSGKTTAIGKLAQYLADQGLRVGLITNDQGRNLVDTATLRSQGFTTEEIPSGCFCCRFNSLVDATVQLTQKRGPNVFIAEPVGSCTDLAASVTFPLRRLYRDDFTVAPISVLVDPLRALRVFGLEPGGSFSEKVLYIYRKQIEEADWVIISKSDLLEAARLETLRTAIATAFPHKELLCVSSRTGANLDAWFARLANEEQTAVKAMDVDYEVYADGEALLGWLNGTVKLAAKETFDANQFLKRLADEIQQRLRALQAEVAHLKMTLSPEAGPANEIGVVNLVRNDFVPELSRTLQRPVRGGTLIVNLRAEAAPAVLADVVREALGAAAKIFPTLQATLDHLEHFRPGKPNPTHRFQTAQ